MKKVLHGLFSIKGLKNKYLSLSIVTVLLTISCFAQPNSPNAVSPHYDTTRVLQPINADGFYWTGKGKFGGALIIPKDTFKLSCQDSNAIAIKGNKLWRFRCPFWYELTGSGGGSISIDTSITTRMTYPLRATRINDTLIIAYIEQSWQDSALAGGEPATKLVSTGGTFLDTATNTVTVMDNIVYYLGGPRDTIFSPVSYVIADAATNKYRTDAIIILSNGTTDSIQGPEDDDVSLTTPTLPPGSIVLAYATVFEDSVISVSAVGTYQRYAIMYIDPTTAQPKTDSINLSYNDTTKSITISGAYISNISGDVAFRLKGGSGIRAYESSSNGRLFLDGAASNTSSYVIQRTGASYQNNNALTPSGNFIIGWDGVPASEISSAKVSIESTSKGFLPPRLTGTQQAGVTSPVAGLIIYNTDSAALCYYNGSVWRAIGSGGSGSGTLQDAYDAGNTITGTTGNDLSITNVPGIVLESTSGLDITAQGSALNISGGQEVNIQSGNGKSITITSENVATVSGADTLRLNTTNNVPIEIASGGAVQITSTSVEDINIYSEDDVNFQAPNRMTIGYGNGHHFNLLNNGGINMQGPVASSDGTDSMLVKSASGDVGLRPLPSVSSTQIDTAYWVGSGQSNMSGQDFTKGTWAYHLDTMIQSLTLGRAWAMSNPATNNICFSDAGATAERNNLLWAEAREYRKTHPNTFVRMIVDAVGSSGSHLWTPKTTGAGEATTSNVRLDSLVSKISSIPSGKKISLFHFAQGEFDISSNMSNWANNVMEIYDTLIHLPQVDSSFLMVITYPVNNITNGIRLTTAIDSFYFHLKDIGNRRIIGVPFNLAGFDATHFDNEGIDNVAKYVVGAMNVGAGFGEKRQDTAMWKPGGGYASLNTSAVINGTSQVVSGFVAQMLITGSANVLALQRTDAGSNGQQQGWRFLLNNSTAGGALMAHYSETSSSPTVKNAVFATDTAIALTNSGLLINSHFAVTENLVIAYKPFVAANIFGSGQLRINGAANVVTSSTAGNQAVIASTGASSGNSAGIEFKLGAVTGAGGSNGSNAGWIRTEHNGTGGRMIFAVSPAFGSYTDVLYINNGRLGIGNGITTPTALAHLAAGTATASTAPLKFTSGTNLTTPEAGAVEFDGTNFFGTASTTRYTLAKTLTASATLDFSSTAAGTSTDLTITVTGAADGDAVSVGVPNASTSSNGNFTAWVSATNTVTIRFSNNSLVSAVDPASGSFRASVVKY